MGPGGGRGRRERGGREEVSLQFELSRVIPPQTIIARGGGWEWFGGKINKGTMQVDICRKPEVRMSGHLPTTPGMEYHPTLPSTIYVASSTPLPPYIYLTALWYLI